MNLLHLSKFAYKSMFYGVYEVSVYTKYIKVINDVLESDSYSSSQGFNTLT